MVLVEGAARTTTTGAISEAVAVASAVVAVVVSAAEGEGGETGKRCVGKQLRLRCGKSSKMYSERPHAGVLCGHLAGLGYA